MEAEKILHNLYWTDFQIFVSVSFVFGSKFSLTLIFRCIKPISKTFSEILLIGDYSSTF